MITLKIENQKTHETIIYKSQNSRSSELRSRIYDLELDLDLGSKGSQHFIFQVRCLSYEDFMRLLKVIQPKPRVRARYKIYQLELLVFQIFSHQKRNIVESNLNDIPRILCIQYVVGCRYLSSTEKKSEILPLPLEQR